MTTTRGQSFGPSAHLSMIMHEIGTVRYSCAIGNHPQFPLFFFSFFIRATCVPSGVPAFSSSDYSALPRVFIPFPLEFQCIKYLNELKKLVW